MSLIFFFLCDCLESQINDTLRYLLGTYKLTFSGNISEIIIDVISATQELENGDHFQVTRGGIQTPRGHTLCINIFQI